MTFLLTLEINIKSIKPQQKLICDITALVASVWNRGKTSPRTEEGSARKCSDNLSFLSLPPSPGECAHLIQSSQTLR